MIYGLIAMAIIMGFGLMIDVFDDGKSTKKPRLKHDEVNAIIMAFTRIEESKNSDILYLLKHHIITYQSIITAADSIMINQGTFSIERLQATPAEIYKLAEDYSLHLRELSHSDINDYIQSVSA